MYVIDDHAEAFLALRIGVRVRGRGVIVWGDTKPGPPRNTAMLVNTIR